MAKSVDSRVVEMRFDNKQFESGVKQSLSTLDRLKAALAKLSSGKTLDLSKGAAASKSSIESIAQSVAALEKRFSFLGETARMAVNKVRDSVVNTLGSAINFVKEGIVSGGIKRATNIENAHYMLQALLKDESKVQAVMDNAMTAVDGTAYAFDEAAKAAAMFAASGIEAGEPMVNALKGVVGTAAMTNSEFERISLIFTSISGQGRVMGDQLLQLASLGLNAPATIAEYFNKIDDASTKASDGVRKAVKALTNGKKVTEADIREMVSDGEIKFKIFAEAMYDAFGDSAEKANETFQGAMSNIKSALARIGAEFVSPLIKQNSAVVKLINRVREKINEVKKALTFDKEANNVNAYSKRFTDSILSMAKSMAKFVENLDVASGMKVFYNIMDSVLNVLKAIGSVVAPLGKAFANVFLSFKVGDVIDATASLKKFTEGLILTEKQSKGLQKAFEGIFSVVKLVVDIFVGLASAIFNINPPVGILKDGFFGLIGILGDGLSTLTKWISESTILKKSLELLGQIGKIAGNAINALVGVVKNFINKAIELRVVETIIGGVVIAFQALGNIVAPIVDMVVEKVKSLASAFGEWASEKLGIIGDNLYDLFLRVKEAFLNFDVNDVSKRAQTFVSAFKEMFATVKANAGGFIQSIKEFGERLKAAFDFSKIVDNIRTFKDLIKEFADWFKSVFGGIFSNASLGGMFAGAGGVGIIYSIIQISKSLDKAMKGLGSIPKVLGSLSEALKGYGASLKADAIKKNAQAILILAGALVVLSFTDTDKALEASEALSLIAGVLLIGTTKLMEVVNKGRSLSTQINYFAKGLGKALNQFGKAVKWKAIGSSFKDMGASILMIAGSLIALGLMYRKDADALQQATIMVGVIAGVMVGVMTLMTLLNKGVQGGSTNFLKTAAAILAISTALGSIIKSLKKIMGLELPNDWLVKFGVLEAMLGSLGLLVLALGGASRIAAGTKIQSGPIVAVGLTLQLCVSAYKKVMDVDLPPDYESRLHNLEGLFLMLGGLIIAIGYAGQLAGGAVKATGTLLALAVDIAVITGSLMILSVIPSEGMLKGAIGLGGVLTVLAFDIAAAGKVATPDAAKAVLNMAIMVGAITAALGVLSMIPIESLAVSAAALGTMLLALALDFLAISKISNESVWQPIVAMVGVLVTIAGSLVILSNQPWQGILAAGAAMSAALLAFAGSFLILSKADDTTLKDAATFLAVTLAVIPIGTALYALSNQPWKNVLASAAAISGTLVAFTAAFAVISKSNPNLSSVVGFVAAAVALIPISAALNMLSGQSWNALLPAATALSGVMAAISVSLVIASKGGTNLAGVLGFVAAAVALIPIANVIEQLSGLSWEEIAKGLVALAGGLVVIGAAAAVGTGIAPGLLALSAALVVFAAGIAAVGAALPIFVQGLTIAVEALKGFLSDLGGAVASMFEAGKNLLSGLALGIASGIQSVLDTIGNVATSIVDKAKSVLGIHSPSTVFEALGVNVDEGFANGILNGEGGVSNAVDSVFNTISDKVQLDSLFGKGEEGSGLFSDGLLSGEGNVDSIMNQLADASGTDVSSFSNLGINGVDNLEGGLLSGSGDIDAALKKLTDTTGVQLQPFDNMGKTATSKYDKGLKSGEGNVKNTLKSITDASKTDVSSYATLGKKASDQFTKGVKSGAKSSSDGAASSVAKVLKNAIESAVKGTNFSASGKEIATALAKGIKGEQEKVKTSIDQVLKVVNNSAKKENTTFKDTGSKLVTSYASGIKSKSNEATNALKTIIKKMATETKSLNKDFKSKGTDIVENLAKGIKSKSSDASKAVKDGVNKMVKELQSKAKSFQQPGKDSASQYTKALKSALDSSLKSLSSSMQTHGKNLVSGLARGINANAGVARQAASKLAKQIDQQIRSDLDIHSPSKVAEKRGKQVVEGLAQGITKNTGKAQEAVHKLTDVTADALKDGVMKIKNRSKDVLSDDYLDKYIKKTIKNVKKSLEGITNLPSMAQEFIKENSLFGGYIKTEEDYWKRLLSLKQRGAEQEKYIGMDLKTFRQSMLDDYKAIMEEYKEAMQSEADNVAGQMDLFAEVEASTMRTREKQADLDYKAAKKEEAAAKAREKAGKKDKETSDVKKEVVKSMGDILKDQNKAYESYEKNLRKAAKRLKDTNLWEYIKNLGVDSLPYLKELNQMTDKELSQYVRNYDEKLQTAYDIATIKMGGVTAETKKNIDEMFSLNEDSIIREEAQRQKSLSLEEQYWTKLLITKKSGAEQDKYLEMDLKEFRQGVLEETNQLIQDYQQQFESTRDSIMSQLDLFTEVEEKQAKTKEELTQILNDQIAAYHEYAATMDQLMDRLQGTNLISYIKDLGVGSLDQLRVINSMTDEELSAYSTLYDQKLEAAGVVANNRLEDVKKDTEGKLQELFGAATEINLDEFTGKFDGTMESLDKYLLNMVGKVSDSTVELQNAVTDMSIKMGNSLTDGIDALGIKAEEGAKNVGTALAKGIENSGNQAAEAAGSVADVSNKAIVQKSPEFQKTGQELGTSYTKGVKDKQNEAQQAGTTLATKTVAGIDSKSNAFQPEGTKQGTSYNTGVKSQYNEAESSGRGLAQKAIDGINALMSQFRDAGGNAGRGLVDGINDNYTDAVYAGENLGNGAIGGIQWTTADFYSIGADAGAGFVAGLQSQVQAAQAAAAQLAAVSKQQPQTILEIHSPSRVMMELGRYAGLGYVNGLLTCVALAANAAKEMGEASVDSTEKYSTLSDIFTDDMVVDPVIKPEVDLSAVEKSVNDIQKMFNRAVVLAAANAQVINTDISMNNRRQTDQMPKQQNSVSANGETKFEFIQNNYSPEPLSRLDIYRQTNNQFSLFKQSVKGGYIQ